MQIRVQMNQRMHKEAQEAAKEARISMSALIREALGTMLLHRREKTRRTWCRRVIDPIVVQGRIVSAQDLR